MHWNVAPGQLQDGETVFSGVAYEEKADREAEEAKARGLTVVGVRWLMTIEHELPSDHHDYDPSQNARGHLWCVIVRD